MNFHKLIKWNHKYLNKYFNHYHTLNIMDNSWISIYHYIEEINSNTLYILYYFHKWDIKLDIKQVKNYYLDKIQLSYWFLCIDFNFMHIHFHNFWHKNLLSKAYFKDINIHKSFKLYYDKWIYFKSQNNFLNKHLSRD